MSAYAFMEFGRSQFNIPSYMSYSVVNIQQALHKLHYISAELKSNEH